MSRVVFLDSGPLSQVTQRTGKPAGDACKHWMQTLISQGCRIIVPEITDYEVRRELLRAGQTDSLKRLYELLTEYRVLAVTGSVLRRAAEFWARARSVR